MSTVLTTCPRTGKRRFFDKATARQEARRQSFEFDRQVHAYRCDWCEGYHTGNPRGSRRRDDRKRR